MFRIEASPCCKAPDTGGTGDIVSFEAARDVDVEVNPVVQTPLRPDALVTKARKANTGHQQ
eukprot:8512234-Prorocentrum_lima.AAC.1